MNTNMEENRKVQSTLSDKKSAVIKSIFLTAIPIILVIIIEIFSIKKDILSSLSVWIIILVLILFSFLFFIGFYSYFLYYETSKNYIKLEEDNLQINELTPVIPLEKTAFLKDLLTRADFYAKSIGDNTISIFVIYKNENEPILFEVLYQGELFLNYRLKNK